VISRRERGKTIGFDAHVAERRIGRAVGEAIAQIEIPPQWG
jgi:hypothetical protein